jgi:hypothetical protein
MEFDHVTNRYSYPDRYIKIIPYFLITVSYKNYFSIALYRISRLYTKAMQNKKPFPKCNIKLPMMIFKLREGSKLLQSSYEVAFISQIQNMVNG